MGLSIKVHVFKDMRKMLSFGKAKNRTFTFKHTISYTQASKKQIEVHAVDETVLERGIAESYDT